MHRLHSLRTARRGACEAVAISLEPGGGVAVRSGDAVVRDGVVTSKHDVLAESLRVGKSPPPQAFQVSSYTDNGKAAFEGFARVFGP